MQNENSRLLRRFTQLEQLNYKPYYKPDVEILYIHKNSKHPHSTLKHIPTLIEKTISPF